VQSLVPRIRHLLAMQRLAEQDVVVRYRVVSFGRTGAGLRSRTRPARTKPPVRKAANKPGGPKVAVGEKKRPKSARPGAAGVL
jgi:hypothetical protein